MEQDGQKPRTASEREELELCLEEADRMVDLLGGIVEFRNGDRDRHVKLLRRVTALLLEELSRRGDAPLSRLEIQRITMAAVVHDVGEIAVSREILEKRGRLTREEFSIMKDHTVIGGEMVSQLLPKGEAEDLMKTAYEVCRWHHERYDGSGYPDGLKGDEIPLSAQVVGLADVYSTMATERSYQKALPQKEVLRMLLAGKCGSFDPLLLECLKAVEDRLLSEEP